MKAQTIKQGVTLYSVALLCLLFITAAHPLAASRDSQLSASERSTAILEKSAVDLLNDGRYSRAASIFADLVSRFPASTRRDSWLYNLARSKYHLGQFENAKRDFVVGVVGNANSEYTGYRWFFLGNIAVRESNAISAARDFIRAFALAEDRRLSALALESLLSLIRSSGDSLATMTRMVDEVYLEQALQSVGPKNSKTDLLNSLNGNPTTVSSVSRHTDFASVRKDIPTVTLALPLSGKLEQYGKRIERGAHLANYVSQEDSRAVVNLRLADTQGSPALAVGIAQQADKDNSLALIGPLTSEEAVAVSATLVCSDLPALAPAANQNDFAKLSQTMFQLSPSPQTIGRRLAEYAFLKLPVATAAVLAQNSSPDKEMATAFSERFEELGGEVVAFEIFPSGATDFGAFGERIKTRFLGAYDDDVPLIGENGDTLDFDEAPIEIGCIFVGATVRQLQLILPQINYHNIKTTLIGSDGLATPSIWDIPLQNVKGIIFTSWRTQDSENSVFRSFAQMYRDRYGESPDRLAALGYDAVRMIIKGIRSGAREPLAMSRYLETLTLHSGASGEVAFGIDHINRELALYTVVEKLPQKLSWNPPRMIDRETD